MTFEQGYELINAVVANSAKLDALTSVGQASGKLLVLAVTLLGVTILMQAVILLFSVMKR
jgi:hypothetical protein